MNDQPTINPPGRCTRCGGLSMWLPGGDAACPGCDSAHFNKQIDAWIHPKRPSLLALLARKKGSNR